MILQKLTGDLQNICHEGDADKDIYIQILDAYYKVGDIQKVQTGNDEEYAFVIKAEV